MATTKRILISGGNGYVGRELTRILRKEHEVCVLDALRSGSIRFRPDELDGLRFQKTDLRDADATKAVVQSFNPDVIVQLAAIHFIPECEQQPELALSTNVNGTLNLLRAAPQGSRFVFASSGAVYRPDDAPHNEMTATIEPSDIYGLTKLHGEHYVRYFATQRQLEAVVVRLFNVVGPGETNPHLLPEIVAQLKSGRSTLSLGNLSPKRDYIHVQDAASGFAATAVRSGITPGTTETINLGTSKSYSVSEVLDKLKRTANIEFSVKQDPSRVRKVDRPHLAADIHRINTVFGWKPRLTIDDALADLWRSPDLAADLMARYM